MSVEKTPQRSSGWFDITDRAAPPRPSAKAKLACSPIETAKQRLPAGFSKAEVPTLFSPDAVVTLPLQCAMEIHPASPHRAVSSVDVVARR